VLTPRAAKRKARKIKGRPSDLAINRGKLSCGRSATIQDGGGRGQKGPQDSDNEKNISEIATWKTRGLTE